MAAVTPARLVPPALLGALLVLASTASVQASAALASGLFDRLSPTAVAGLRQAVGAAGLLLLVRPRLRGRTRGNWVAIGVLALGIAATNAAYYQAVALLPLGVAATLLYLGPFALAARHTPVGPQLLLPVAALAGVALVAGLDSGAAVSPAGLLVGLVAAAALAAYTLASRHLGRSGGRLDSLALAIGGSALLLSPAAVPAVGRLGPGDAAVLLLTGAGVVVTFGCDFYALRVTTVRLVSVLFALDPAIGVLVGALVLSQSLRATVLVGVALIVLAGAVVTALTGGADDGDGAPGHAA